MTFRLAQISDTHLSRERPWFVANFELAAGAVTASKPDLVVNTGDMSFNGAEVEDDLAEARRLHDVMLPGQVRFIPGNHDIGECHDAPGSSEARISARSRERYLRHFGDDFWRLDIPGWRFIAINAQLPGSDLASAREQLAFVADAAASAGDRAIALFTHKPLFDASPDETAVTGRFINPASRNQLLSALGTSMPAVVASGHVHQYRLTKTSSASHAAWAPSTGFIIPDARQPTYGVKDVGYLEHTFGADGAHACRYVSVPGLRRLDISEFVEL